MKELDIKYMAESKIWVEQIRDKRIKMNLSISEISIKTGIDRTLLSRYESGERQIPLKHFLSYLKALNCYIVINDEFSSIINQNNNAIDK